MQYCVSTALEEEQRAKHAMGFTIRGVVRMRRHAADAHARREPADDMPNNDLCASRIPTTPPAGKRCRATALHPRI